MGKIYEWLDEVGSKELLNIIDGIANDYVTNMVENDTSKPSDSTSFSAAASIALVNGILHKLSEINDKKLDAGRIIYALSQEAKEASKLKMAIYIGKLNDIDNPDPDTLYFHKESLEATDWFLSIYSPKGWLTVGDLNNDLTRYWNKTEDVGAMLIEPIGDEYIIQSAKDQFHKVTSEK